MNIEYYLRFWHDKFMCEYGIEPDFLFLGREEMMKFKEACKEHCVFPCEDNGYKWNGITVLEVVVQNHLSFSTKL